MLTRNAILTVLLSAVLGFATPAQAQDYPHPLFEKAQAALTAGDLDAAQKYLQKGLKKVPDHANAWVNLGNIHLMREKPDEAVSAFEVAIALDPRHFLAMNGLGAASLQQGETAPAIEWFLSAVEAEPEYVTPLVNLGDVGLILGRPEFAIKYYALALERPRAALGHLTRAADRDSKRLDVMRTLALTAMQLGEWPIAERAYRGALDLKDDSADLHFEIGQMYYKMGLAGEPEVRFERALKHLSAAMTLEPNRADVKSQMADVYEEQGDIKSAVEAWEAALADDSNYCPALNNLGRRKMVEDDVAAATVLFDKCLEAQPNFAMARLNRGLLYAKIGRCGQARSELEPFTTGESAFSAQVSSALQTCQ